MLEMIHVLGNSYRLASSGMGSSVLYGRFALGFCRAAVLGVAGNFVSRRLRHAHATLRTRFSPWPPAALGDRRLDSINGRRSWATSSSDFEQCGLRPMERRL
jgi:hypothetical protein